LKTTSIVQVPLISHKIISDINDFTKLMKLKSSFYDGLVEGVYVRICEGDFTVNRAKIVRKDFICGEGLCAKHWTKNNIVVNSLVTN